MSAHPTDRGSVAAWIRDGRHRLNMSQTELAKLTHIRRDRIWAASAGVLVLNPDELARVRAILGATPPGTPTPP